MRYMIILLIILNYSFSGAQEMIVDITESITTDFAVYHPVEAEFAPNAVPYTVNSDFQNVEHFNNAGTGFSSADSLLLAENYFTVKYSRFKQLYDIYNDCTWIGMPLFITTDCILHIYHVLYDKMLAEIEEKYFYTMADTFTTILLEKADQMYDKYTSDNIVKDALLLNTAYLTVAKELLNESGTEVTDTVSALADSELNLIKEQDGFHFSPVMGSFTKFDYSQFKPRGHYTRNDTLKAYFKTMMWYGWSIFTMEPELFGDLSTRHTLQALILTQMICELQSENGSLYDIWKTMYEVTSFFTGRTDDPNLVDYKTIADQVYGPDFCDLPVDSLANSALLAEFIQEAGELPEPEIPNWVYGSTSLTYKGWRFMGQRFIPDSYIFSRLVLPEVPLRIFPMGLDIMSVFGSDRAYSLLDTLYHETAYENYPEKIDTLTDEFSAKPGSDWVKNLYWNWLYCLMPLLYEKGAGYPSFMQTDAWGNKELLTALASWAELRHDTILYAKQSMTPCCVPPGPPRSYVEPNPYLYARTAALVRYTKSGMENFNLLLPKYKRRFDLFDDLLIFLRNISIKELENREITSEEYENLFCFGKVMEQIISFDDGSGNPFSSNTDDMAVIADVHTDSNTDQCLEEGVGYPLEIFIIANHGGQMRLTRGAIFSYYEFKQDIEARLNDEEWRKLLESDPPDMPRWIESFMDVNQKPLDLLDNSPENLYEKEFNSIDLPSSQSVTDFVLHPNYPNPFNSQTSFTFELLRRADVSVVIYNMLGKRVRILFRGILASGRYTFTWNGTGEFGRKLTSGVYLLKITAPGFVDVKKMCLMQ